MTPAQLLLLGKIIGALVVAGALWWAKSAYDASVRAPVERERDAALATVESCQANRKSLEGQISTQNGAIATLKDEAKSRADASARAAEAARKAAETNYKAAQQLLQSAPLDPDLCVSARKRGRIYVEGRARP